MLTNTPVNIFWFRRDLRTHDNAGLYHALKAGIPVLPVFIFDTNILLQLENKSDPRVTFIHTVISEINSLLKTQGSAMEVFYGTPVDAFKKLTEKYQVSAVYCNNDYEPYALERDEAIKELCACGNIQFHSFKDHVLFEKSEVVKNDDKPYTVFTPYSRKWRSLLTDKDLQKFSSEELTGQFLKYNSSFPSLKDIGFTETKLPYSSLEINKDLVKKYGTLRDFPFADGTTRLGIHLRFGTISIRQLAAATKDLSETFLNELIWRDFYQMILWHFPQVGKGQSFKPAYDNIEWRRDEGEFEKWCNGQTGYPIVDAGMRQLNSTGFMHNRIRMITASFLCKHLLIDWRLGEAYFAEKLLDYDLASNNGGWQWAAGSGCDAAPYFRIFNPYLQTKKFDPDLGYIKKWVPEFQDPSYPKPIVEHESARKRCLEIYSKSLKRIDP